MKRNDERASPTPSRENDYSGEVGRDPIDFFSIIVYGMVAVAMLGQAGWIIWMEYIQ
jgi:nitrate reductase NapE component